MTEWKKEHYNEMSCNSTEQNERGNKMALEDNFRKVTPYVPGEQPKIPNLIKLNTNENPYPPAPGVRDALLKLAEDPSVLRKYPAPDCEILEEAIADYYGISRDRLFVGVGSDDVLSMAFLTFFNSKKPVLFPDITYSFYDVWAEVYGIPYKQIPLDENFEIRAEDYRMENGGIVIANPNAPTGVAKPKAWMEDFLKEHTDTVVIVDEAYVDFGAESVIDLIDKYENLLVVQTFSKSRSMAGMRIGMAFGSKLLIKYLKDVKFSVNSYTMNTTSLLLGVEAIRDDAYFREKVQAVIATRERVKLQLKSLGFVFRDSKTNFIFASHPAMDASEIMKKLRERGIIVRHFSKPRIDQYLRISIGTDAEMDELIKALAEILHRW